MPMNIDIINKNIVSNYVKNMKTTETCRERTQMELAGQNDLSKIFGQVRDHPYVSNNGHRGRIVDNRKGVVSAYG